MATGLYIEIPLMTENVFIYCRTLSVPKGTYFGGITIAPNHYNIMTIFIQAFIPDQNAESTYRHIHVEPMGHRFETDDAVFIGAGVLPTPKGWLRFAVIELDPYEHDDTLIEEDLGITSDYIPPTTSTDVPDISIEDYRKLFNSEHITITRDDDMVG